MTRRCALAVLAAPLAKAAAPHITGLRAVVYRVSDLQRSLDFYTGILGFPMATGINGCAYLQVNSRQSIGLMHHPKWDGVSDRFVEIAFDAESDSDRISDPDGHTLQYVTPGSRTTVTRSNRISEWMTHAGITVANEAKAMAFYRDELGFREIWRGGRDEKTINWINMRLPGSTGDYIEFMLVNGEPTLAQLGSMHHICLHSDDIQKTWAELKRRGIPDEERFRPRVGRNGRWLLNTFDPDGTRVEFMEPRLATKR